MDRLAPPVAPGQQIMQQMLGAAQPGMGSVTPIPAAPAGMGAPAPAPAPVGSPLGELGLSPTESLNNPYTPGFGPPPAPAPTGTPPGQEVLLQMLGAVQGMGAQETSLERRRRRGFRAKPQKGVVMQSMERDSHRYATLVSRMGRDVAMYRQHTSGTPRNFKGDRESRATSAALSTLVNRMSNILSGSKITYKAPWRTTDESKSSQVIEDWAQQMRKMLIREYAKNRGGNLQRDEFFYMLLHGRLVYRILPRPENEKFPFRVSLLDPATVYPTFGADGLVRVTRKYRAKVADVITDYGLDEGMQKKLASKLGYDQFSAAEDFWDTEGDVYEYWDSWWRCVTFADVDVLPLTAHEYGRVPFIYQTPVGEPEAMTTPNGRYPYEMQNLAGSIEQYVDYGEDLAQKGVSVFHHLVNTHRLREALTTLLYNEVEKSQNPPTITYSAPHLMGREPAPLDVKAGGNNQRQLNLQKVEGIPTSPRPTDLSPLTNQVTGEWIDGTIPPMGGPQDMGSTGQGIGPETVFGTVREIALPYVKSWEAAQSLMIEMMLEYYMDFIAPLGLMSVPEFTDTGRFSGRVNRLQPEDIDRVGTYVEATMKGASIQNLAMRTAMANQAIQAGLVSQRFAMEEWMELDDPEKMLGEIISEKAIQHPEMMENVIIPKGFIAQGSPDLAKIWLQLIVMPKMMQNMMGMMPGMGGMGGMGGGAMGQPAPTPLPGGGGAPTGAPSPSGGGEPMQPPMM